MEYTNQRVAYGNTLVELGKTNKDIVVLDADLGGSTYGKLFEAAYPDRHIELSIAEANMISVAGGLSLTGHIPFANSFAVFATGRAFDQIRQSVSIGELNVKVVGSSAGFSDFGDGATHQSVEDISLMRSIPNMTVICPADANETVKAVKAMVSQIGPCYLRLNRNDYPNVTKEIDSFKIGQPTILREGNEIVVFAIGYMLNKVLQACEELKGQVSVKVINMSTLKPVNKAFIVEAVKDMKAVVTVEEHSVIGGLGSTILEALSETPKPVKMLGIQDTFGCSAHSYESLLEYMGLTVENIKKAILEMAGKKEEAK